VVMIGGVREAEPLTQELQIQRLHCRKVIPRVTEELRAERDAVHRAPCDHPVTSQVRLREDEPIVIRPRWNPPTLLVEAERVDAELAARPILQDKGGRDLALLRMDDRDVV